MATQLHKSDHKTEKLHRSAQGGNNGPLCRKRPWCFTDFKVTAPQFTDEMSYLLYAPEICPETNKAHWQSYVVFKNAKTRSATSKCLGNVFCVIAEGDIDHQLNYIRGPYQDKDKIKPFNPEWIEIGDRPAQGKRCDLQVVCAEILDGSKSCESVLIETPMMYHQYGRTLDKIEDIRKCKEFRTEMTTCNWFVGKTGVGKSHEAFKDYSPDTHYPLPNDRGWWDGYKQQETVLINDFRGHIPYNELLQLIDKWPHSVPRRGRMPIPFTSKHIIITSSLKPEEVYCNREAEDKIEQLLRRVVVIELKR